MNLFIRVPPNARKSDVIINLEKVKTIAMKSTERRVIFRLAAYQDAPNKGLLSVDFETLEEAKEWFEYISELITTK